MRITCAVVLRSLKAQTNAKKGYMNIYMQPLNPGQTQEKSEVVITFWIRSNTVLHMLQQFDSQ